MAQAEQPRGVRRLDFGALTDEDFEVLCYLVVQIEYPEAIRLRPPDLGADSALRDGTSQRYMRCWQAKRFTQHIHWGQCVASLDKAFASYAMPHYTFCFARDLTGNQEKTFRQRLVSRHVGVAVDHWSESRLLGTLLSSPHGHRIANHFYPDPALNTTALMQAIRAGGPIEDGEDVGVRLSAIADWLANYDPFFSYTTHTRETGVAAPGLTPGAVIAIEEVEGDITRRIEAVPRNDAALEEYGLAGALLFEDTEEGRRALADFQRALDAGTEVTMGEGVAMRFDRLPPLMQPYVREEPLPVEVTVGPSQPAPPRRWPAHIVVSSDAGSGQIDIDLEPVQPPSGWEGALQGSRGGLLATLLLRRTDVGGQARFDFKFSYDAAVSAADQLAATTALIALHGVGTVEIHARDGSRPEPMVFALTDRDPPAFLAVLHQLLEDLRVIEEWAGTRLALPEIVDESALRSVAEVAYIIRNRKSRMNFDEVTLELDEEHFEPFKAGMPGWLRVVLPANLKLAGEVVALGYLVGELPPSDVRVAEATPVEGSDPPTWLVRLEPATDEGQHPVFRFQRDPP